MELDPLVEPYRPSLAERIVNPETSEDERQRLIARVHELGRIARQASTQEAFRDLAASARPYDYLAIGYNI